MFVSAPVDRPFASASSAMVTSRAPSVAVSSRPITPFVVLVPVMSAVAAAAESVTDELADAVETLPA